MTDQNTTLYTLKELSEKTNIPERSIAYYRDSYPNCLPSIIEPGTKNPKYTAQAVEILGIIRDSIAAGKAKSEIIEDIQKTYALELQDSAKAQQKNASLQNYPGGAIQAQAGIVAQAQAQAMTNIATSFTSALDLIKERTEKDQTELEQLREENKALKIANAVMKNELLNTKKQNQKSLLSRLEDLIR